MREVRLREWSTVEAQDERVRGLYLDPNVGVVVERLSAAGFLNIQERREGLSISSRAHVGRIDRTQTAAEALLELAAIRIRAQQVGSAGFHKAPYG